MRIPRVYYNGDLILNNELILSKEASHHVNNVLRRKQEDILEVFNGIGKNYLAKILDISTKLVVVKLTESIPRETESSLSIQLGVSLIKADKMDFAIQKAVELGVNSITPILSIRSNINVSRVENKIRHWRTIIINSCAQSGRTQLPEISVPIKFKDWLDDSDEHDCIYFEPESKNKLQQLSFLKEKIKILIGPEGGLANEEIQTLDSYKWHKISLGKRILRSETAVVAALAILQNMKGDM